MCGTSSNSGCGSPMYSSTAMKPSLSLSMSPTVSSTMTSFMCLYSSTSTPQHTHTESALAHKFQTLRLTWVKEHSILLLVQLSIFVHVCSIKAPLVQILCFLICLLAVLVIDVRRICGSGEEHM